MKVDFTGTIDGVAFAGGQAQDFPITLGGGRMLPEFETALAGMKTGGEELSAHVSRRLPRQGSRRKTGAVRAYREERRAAAGARTRQCFRRDVRHQVGQARGPAREVASNLRLELKRKVESNLRDQAMKVLRETTQVPLPESLVEMETRELARRMSANLQQQGMKAEDIKLSPEMFKAQAEERVALGLIVSQLVREKTSSPVPTR